jgi:transposase-like protein
MWTLLWTSELGAVDFGELQYNCHGMPLLIMFSQTLFCWGYEMTKMPKKYGEVKAGKSEVGSKRYKCQYCQVRYTHIQKERSHPDELRFQAIKMYVEGINYRQIGRLPGVTLVSVMNWVKALRLNVLMPPCRMNCIPLSWIG